MRLRTRAENELYHPAVAESSFDPPFAAPEREMLVAWLDYQRHSILHKLEGITVEQARWKPAAMANSLLGLVWHLGLVEQDWFREFAGEPMEDPPAWAAPDDRDWDFHA